MKEHLAHAQNIWTFLNADHTVKRSDFILVLGSSDLRVPRYASEFWFRDLAGYIVVSGGWGKKTREMWPVSEAEKFSEILAANGVPANKIILEDKATNTGENINNTKKLIADLGLPAGSGILITKPYMKRRAFNTASKQWPEVDWSASAEPVAFDDYLRDQDDAEYFLNLLVGDLQRIKVYADLDFQVRDEIPDPVWDSFEALVRLGYDQHLVK